MELPERDSLGLAMFAAWLNVRVDQIPAENRIHTSPDTMAAWERVAKAAIRAMLDGVESNLSAVQYDPAPYTAMKHRIAAMRKEVE